MIPNYRKTLASTLTDEVRKSLHSIANSYRLSHPEWYNGGYMTHLHPDAFDNIPKKPPPSSSFRECPKCQGHGGWNLRLNAYGPGEHFRCSCQTCGGRGWIPESQTCPNHNFSIHVSSDGRCLNTYECENCGERRQIDSSD